MSEARIFQGSTTSEAIEKGLKELNVSKDDVEIKVLKDESKKSFFSILAPRVVKVEIKLKEKQETENNDQNIIKNEEKEIKPVSNETIEKAEQNIKTFLDKFLSKIDSSLTYKIENSEGIINVDIDGQNVNYLIGYRGETLNAIQTILNNVAGKGIQEKIRVSLNMLGYKEKRKKVLEELADKIAKTVIKNKKAIALEPMNAYERKIIHFRLQDNKKVKTSSVGEGEHRKVIISLK